MLSLLTLALTIAILEHAAAAETFETVFATQPGGIACFARYYDRAHLQAHPRQKVASIEIDMRTGKMRRGIPPCGHRAKS